MKEKGLVVFQDKKIRRVWQNDEWFYSVTDIVLVLTDSQDELAYWRKLKQREPQLVTICHGLKLLAKDGKLRYADCVNTKNAFRLIQSIPSKKAEPFKQWLAQLAQERIEEIENPELAQKRMKEFYKAKGYSDDWIEKRARGIAIRDELTDEWKKRGVTEEKDFAILTAEISKATFGMTPSEYKKHKQLSPQSKANLRDHMNDLELIFAMLGERMTTEISQQEKPDSFGKNKDVAKRGGNVAGIAREKAEKELGHPIISKENYLSEPEKKKKIAKKP